MGVCTSSRNHKDLAEDHQSKPLKKTKDRLATRREAPSSKILVDSPQLETPQEIRFTKEESAESGYTQWNQFTPEPLPLHLLNTSEDSHSNRMLLHEGLDQMRPSRSDAQYTDDGDLLFQNRSRVGTGGSAGSRLSTFAKSGRRGTLSMTQRLKSMHTLLTNDELLMDQEQQVDCVDNLNDLLESQKILTRLQSTGDYMKRAPTNKRSSKSTRKSIITSATKRALQKELTGGERLKDVVEVFPKNIKHPEAINYWREFKHIRFYKSPTVTEVISKILETNIPEIGESYQTIINEFLTQDWPINIFLHGGLMRDIMTSTIGNDVDIAFTCPHTEMKEICDKKDWVCTIRQDIPYWVIGGESNFETKLEGFPLSFNGLSRFHITDFACNTIYYDCKNQILIDRYGKGVNSALDKKLTLPIFSPEDKYKWRDTDFIPGVKMYRFFKFVTRGFDYDKEAAVFIQSSLIEYVEADPQGAETACFHALRKLARGQDSRRAANEYKDKLKKAVKDLFLDIGATNDPPATKAQADEYWEQTWETNVNKVINQGKFKPERNVERANLGWDVEESDYDDEVDVEHVGTVPFGGDEIVSPGSNLGTAKTVSVSGFE